MPFQIADPTYQTFHLERTDAIFNPGEEANTTVTIRQARQHEHSARQDQWARFERKYSQANPDMVSIVSQLSVEAIKMLEVYMVLIESNILAEDGEKELFPSKKDKEGHATLNMTKVQFESAWGKLPPSVASEIHEKVLEVNPMWDSTLGEVD